MHVHGVAQARPDCITPSEAPAENPYLYACRPFEWASNRVRLHAYVSMHACMYCHPFEWASNQVPACL